MQQIAADENDDIGCTRAKINDPYIDVDIEFAEENNEEESIEIYVGKEFKSPEEAYNFYNLFALIRGFSIRKNHKGSSRKGVSGVQFVCSKQGLSDRQKSEGKPVGSSSKPKTPEKKRSFTRTDCKAYMRVKLVDGGIWRVSRFNDEHNHLMVLDSPAKKRGLRSQRCLTMDDKQTIRDLNDQNVGPSKIAQYLSILKGGRQNLLFRTKDVSNVIGAENKKYLGVDIDSTLLHFQKKKEVDPEFFYAVDADEDGFVRHIFWAEGRSRRAYLEFGLFSCNCKGFEFDGLLCSHALIVMWMNGVEHIPAHYILKRWCRNANAGVKRPMNERSRDAGNTLALQMFRATTLKNQSNLLVDLASKDIQSFNKVEAKLRELVAEVQLVHNESLSQKPVCEAIPMSTDDDVMKQATTVLRDPPISNCKGRKKRPERWKVAAEKAPIKGRMCRYCKKVAKHNIRTCPKKKEDEGKGKKNGHRDGSSESYGEDFSGEEDSGEDVSGEDFMESD